MLQYRFIDLAQQGNSKAIATLLNGKLHPQGINAKASFVNGWLHILLESEELPDKSSTINLVRNELIELAPESIKKVKLLFKRYSDDYATWTQEFDLELNSFSRLIVPIYPENKDKELSLETRKNGIKNPSLNNLRMSQITLMIVVVILLMALVIFIGKMLVEKQLETPNSGTVYPQVLDNQENLI
ncbi:MAG: hypothetical protein AB4080_03170 [Trichodesmium sp.]